MRGPAADGPRAGLEASCKGEPSPSWLRRKSPFSLEMVCESRPELLEIDLDLWADFGGKGTAGVMLLRLSVREIVSVESLEEVPKAASPWEEGKI